MREIDKIIIHCSATKEGQEISAATIDEWHKARGLERNRISLCYRARRND